MKKLLITILLLTVAFFATAGEHLKSWEKFYSYEAHQGENFTVIPVTQLKDTDGWLSISTSLFPGDTRLYVRIAIRDAETKTLYYYGILKPGQIHDFTFPFMVHSFHPLNVHLKCVNETEEVLPCMGYVVLYAK